MAGLGRQWSSLAARSLRAGPAWAGFLSLLRRQPPCRNALVETHEPLPDCVGHSAWIASRRIGNACPNETFDVKALFRPSPPGIAAAGEDSEVLVADRDVTHGADREWSAVLTAASPNFLSHAQKAERERADRQVLARRSAGNWTPVQQISDVRSS